MIKKRKPRTIYPRMTETGHKWYCFKRWKNGVLICMLGAEQQAKSPEAAMALANFMWGMTEAQGWSPYEITDFDNWR